MTDVNTVNPIEILLLEDSPADVRLTNQFPRVVKTIQDFWMTIVKLPPKTM